MRNLWAQEVDADRRIRDYQEEIRKKILDMYGFDKVPEEIDNYIAAASAEPAMEESAIFDAVEERDLRRGRGHHRQGRLRLLHLRPGPARPRALLPQHGEGLRRVDQQDHEAP